MRGIIRVALILLLIAFPNLGYSAERTDLTTVQQLAASCQKKDYAEAKKYISSNSTDLLNRFSKYNLASLTPTNITRVSESENKPYRYLKIQNASTAKIMTVALVTENKEPKVDLEETLRLGFGADWKQKINTIEQTYNLSRMHLGEAQSLQLLNALLAKQSSVAQKR